MVSLSNLSHNVWLVVREIAGAYQITVIMHASFVLTMYLIGEFAYTCNLWLQSSALGYLLARRHFTNPLVAVPSAVSVVCMAVWFHWQCPCNSPALIDVYEWYLLPFHFLLVAWWKCTGCVLEEQTDSCGRQGWLQGMKFFVLSRLLFSVHSTLLVPLSNVSEVWSHMW